MEAFLKAGHIRWHTSELALNREFYRSIRSKVVSPPMFRLKDEQGQLHTEIDDMHNMAEHYYSQLFKEEPWDEHPAWSDLVPGSMLEHGQANDPGNEPTHLNLCLQRLLLITLPKHEGGLNIIDIEEQCKALLFKIFTRMLMLGNQPWRILLRAQLLKALPDKNEHTRQNWVTDEQWLFSDTKLKMTKAHTFLGKLFKLWRQFKCKLERKPPHTKEQLDRQPIFLSKLFAVKGKMLRASEDRGLDQTCRDLHRAGMRTFTEADTMIQPNQTTKNRDRISAFYGLTISEHRMRKFQTAFLAAKHACLERLNLQEDQYH
ncbi:hypothetical protein SELMODRAFT_402324 [Selaginella moellendorffii]|uniref:Uncharacterized protein n=1 Tax=Selaginella moellendorffii TaxID=88036 RepID=D8QQA1_SELML|nr:hypothetical protein SELMODRAFT_402324 [Selaginella moellendorffii]